MTNPLAKWQATDLRDEMIEVISKMPTPDHRDPTCDEIADAILELLARWDVGRLPDE